MSLSKDELAGGYRLACCAILKHEGSAIVDVPPESRLQLQQLLVAGIEVAVPRDVTVKKFFIQLTQPSLQNAKSDFEVLQDALANHGLRSKKADLGALTSLPLAIRSGRWAITVSMRDDEIICVEPGDTTRRIFGLAVDVGTTKIAAYLLDLNDGKLVGTASAQNPQIPYGEDIITRISFASKEEGNLKQLQGVVIASVNQLLLEACERASVNPSEVFDVVLVGNTVMNHLFLGISPRFLGASPYPPVVGRTPMSVRAKDVGLRTNSSANVYVPPNIAGFVGADAVADIIATEIDRSKFLSLLIDVGTNTEIVLGNEEGLMACSCASGPALEGGHIEFGMRAEPGAIENVYIDPDTFEPWLKTVADMPPRGICGSGIVDAVAAMLKTGIISRDGLINTQVKSARIRVDGVPCYVLSLAAGNDLGRDIVVTQRDVQEIQLAKAAIYAGSVILMKHLKVKSTEIERIFLAGAFGTYVDPQNAMIVGMYPDVPLERVQFAGNAAGSGARMALLSRKVRENIDHLVEKTGYIELAADPSFQSEFAAALQLPHKDLTRFPTIAQLLN